MSRLYVRRKSGHLSPYSVGDFYVAAITRPREYGTSDNATPMIRLGGKYRPIPLWGMQVFRPFNRYRDAEGRKVSTNKEEVAK